MIFVLGLLLTGVAGGDIVLPECKPIELNGYLHELCPTPDRYYDIPSPFMMKCPRSNTMYFMYFDWWIQGYRYTAICPSDPGFYQACGHFSGTAAYKELAGTPLLCGTFICNAFGGSGGVNATGWYYDRRIRCESGVCGNTELNMAGCNDKRVTASVTAQCDNICDDQRCPDESICNRVQYGVWCDGKYIPPFLMCDDNPWDHTKCANGEDEVGCTNWTVADHTTCRQVFTSKIIKIQDSMRCFHPEYSACLNRQDQTNCRDPERVAMQCLSQGFPTTISKWGYCQGYALCDDGYNNVCVDPELGCKIHKGQLCDGHRDCNEGKDETCKDLTTVTCIRRFRSPNVEKNVSLLIPLQWVMDGEVDCLDGTDEDESQWKKCGIPPGVVVSSMELTTTPGIKRLGLNVRKFSSAL
eukprot:sb/3465174/